MRRKCSYERVYNVSYVPSHARNSRILGVIHGRYFLEHHHRTAAGPITHPLVGLTPLSYIFEQKDDILCSAKFYNG